MKIAIVGAGVSGLVAAHLLHREHEITVFEAGDYAGGHTNTIRVDTADETHHVDTGFIVFNDRNYPNFERLLGALGVASQPSTMSFSVSDGRATSSTAAPRPTACSPSARTCSPPGSTAWSPTSRASTAAARELLRRREPEEPSLGALARAAALLAPVRRAPDRAPGLGRVVGGPGADVELPRPLPGRVLREPRHARLPRPAAVAHGAAAARRATSRRSPRRSRDRLRLVDPGAGDPPRTRDHVRSTPRGGEPERFDEVVLATHSDQALALLADATDARARAARARSPTSPTRRSCTPTSQLLPRRRRAWASWNYHLLDAAAAPAPPSPTT